MINISHSVECSVSNVVHCSNKMSRFRWLIFVMMLVQIEFGRTDETKKNLACENFFLVHGIISVEDVHLCSHIIYAHGYIDRNESKFKIWRGFDNKYLEQTISYQRRGLTVLVLFRLYEKLNTKEVIEMKEKRKRFVESAIDFISTHNLNGICLGMYHEEADTVHYLEFLKELYKAFKPKNYTLGIKATNEALPMYYNKPELFEHIDSMTIERGYERIRTGMAWFQLC